MANICITGSADGLGQLTARALVKAGHRVVLHERNEQRGRQALVGYLVHRMYCSLTFPASKKQKVLVDQEGDPGFDKILDGDKSSIDEFTYSETKLHDLILAMTVARKWPHVYTNTVDPDWVPTKMGGSGAPDNLQKGFETQVWLAVREEPDASSSGHYYHHKKQLTILAPPVIQRYRKTCSRCAKKLPGVSFPAASIT